MLNLQMALKQLQATILKEQKPQIVFTIFMLNPNLKQKTMERMVSMRLSEKDNEYIETQAKKERLSKSSWIRRKIFLNNK